jgi:DNA repair protein RadC
MESTYKTETPNISPRKARGTDIPVIDLNYQNRQHRYSGILITNSQDICNVLFKAWDQKTIESLPEVKVILLKRSGFVNDILTVSSGEKAIEYIPYKLITGLAVLSASTSIILAQNRYTGNTTTTSRDIKATHELKEMCSILDISLLDHIILRPIYYYSFADEGTL